MTFLKAFLDTLLLGVPGLFISPCDILQSGLRLLRRALASWKRRACQSGRRAWAAMQAAWAGLCRWGRSRRRPGESSRPQKPSPPVQPAPPASKPSKRSPSSAPRRDGKAAGSSFLKQRAAPRAERQPAQQQEAASESAAGRAVAGSSDGQQQTPDASPRREQASLIGSSPAVIAASPSVGPSAPSESPTLPAATLAQPLPDAPHGQAAPRPPSPTAAAATAAAAFPGLDEELLRMLFPSGSRAEASPRPPRAPPSGGASPASSEAESVQPLRQAAEPPAEKLPAAEPPAAEPEECVVCLDAPPAATLAPCGHRVLCAACVLLVLAPRKRGQAAFCPYCSQEVRAALGVSKSRGVPELIIIMGVALTQLCGVLGRRRRRVTSRASSGWAPEGQSGAARRTRSASCLASSWGASESAALHPSGVASCFCMPERMQARLQPLR